MKNWENPPKDWAEAEAIELLKDYWNMPMRDMLAKAIRDERERCAMLADCLSKEVGDAIRRVNGRQREIKSGEYQSRN